MKINATIEARMGSSRLPGKVLLEVLGKPILWWMVERVKKSKFIDNIIIATTISKKDDDIVKFCRKYNIDYFRGSEENVLDRVLKAHKKFNTDIIVELTGDCPLIDANIIDQCINFYLKNDYDYVSNCVERSYPDGMDVQVYNTKILEEISKQNDLTDLDKEHVTPYIYQSGKYKIYTLIAPKQYFYPDLGLTLDTKEDFEVIKQILEHFNKKDFSLKDILKFLDKNPQILVNKYVKRKRLS
jgi:spore coat polysaccharide biosynthesis protein SpsF